MHWVFHSKATERDLENPGHSHAVAEEIVQQEVLLGSARRENSQHPNKAAPFSHGCQPSRSLWSRNEREWCPVPEQTQKCHQPVRPCQKALCFATGKNWFGLLYTFLLFWILSKDVFFLALFQCLKSFSVLIRIVEMCIISPSLENRDIQNEHLLLISQTAVELRRISWDGKICN